MAAGDIHALMTIPGGSSNPVIVGNATTGRVSSGATTGRVT
jgi:hypothetical protein